MGFKNRVFNKIDCFLFSCESGRELKFLFILVNKTWISSCWPSKIFYLIYENRNMFNDKRRAFVELGMIACYDVRKQISLSSEMKTSHQQSSLTCVKQATSPIPTWIEMWFPRLLFTRPSLIVSLSFCGKQELEKTFRDFFTFPSSFKPLIVYLNNNDIIYLLTRYAYGPETHTHHQHLLHIIYVGGLLLLL